MTLGPGGSWPTLGAPEVLPPGRHPNAGQKFGENRPNVQAQADGTLGSGFRAHVGGGRAAGRGVGCGSRGSTEMGTQTQTRRTWPREKAATSRTWRREHGGRGEPGEREGRTERRLSHPPPRAVATGVLLSRGLLQGNPGGLPRPAWLFSPTFRGERRTTTHHPPGRQARGSAFQLVL